MSCKSVLFIPVFFFFFIVKAQQNIALESTIPPAPNAAELGKYGTYPVGTLTGVPDISFPLYEVNTGKLRLPITLSYHASGIKVNERSTDVGLGWVISAGGTISRTVYGSADDNQYGYFNYTAPDYQTLQNTADFTLLQSYANNPGYDLEPDLFVYNFGGRSGKFIYDNANQNFITIPFDPIAIHKDLGYQNKVIFQLTDDNGTIYQFNNYGSTFSENGDVTHNTISSWYLTYMISSDYTDTISFTYQSHTISDWMEQQSFPVGDGINLAQGCLDPVQPVQGPSNASVNVSHTTLNYTELYLTNIKFRGGYIQFNRNTPRLDMDAPVNNMLDAVIVYNNNTKVVKNISFNHDYYTTKSFNTSYQNKKLRLTGFVASGEDGVNKQQYQFGYDATQIPEIGSYAQDYWGYYNGVNNQNLIPVTTITGSEMSKGATFSDGLSYSFSPSWISPTNTYTIGSANREPNATYMQAGILNKITYPTGGYSFFRYEPHQYSSSSTVQQSVVKGGQATGIDKMTISQQVYNFSYPTDPATTAINDNTLANISIDFSVTSMANAIVDPVPQKVILMDNNTNVAKEWTHTGDLTIAQSINENYQLFAGHTYQLTVIDYGPSTTFSRAVISWKENTTTQNVTKIVGGLRIKSINNYDSDDKLLKEENYVYGANEDGLGIKIFDERFFYKNYQDVVLEAYLNPNNGLSCQCNPEALQRQYMGISQYSSLNYLGSPVLYSNVTKYEGSATNNIGKTVYTYNIIQDANNIPLDFINSGNYGSINNAWNQGELVDETTYKKNGTSYTPVLSKTYSYTEYNQSQYHAIMIRQYKQIVSQNCGVSGNSGLNTYGDRLPGLAHIAMFQYPIKTGASRKTSETIVTYDQQTGAKLSDVTTYQYLNTGHLYPNVIDHTPSSGSHDITNNYYPQDMVSSSDPTGIYGAMVQKNILSLIVRNESYKGTQMLQSSQKFYSNSFSANANQILPQQHVLYNKSSLPVKTINYNQYNSYGNILEEQIADNIKQSYIWDYNSVYPIAEATNASQNDIAYTSFETEDGKGNWDFYNNPFTSVSDQPNIVSNNPLTGRRVYALSANSAGISKSNLNTSKVYFLTYWYYLSEPVVTGINHVIEKKTIMQKHLWTLVSVKFDNTSSINIKAPLSSGGSMMDCVVDELRLYPSNAQMSTYTYEPLVGMTSQCDVANRITYYEYDEMGRLARIRDMDNNILKQYCYNYDGQTAPCNVPFCVNAAADYSNTKPVSYSVVMTNTATSANYTFTINATSGSGTVTGNQTNIPSGIYNITMTPPKGTSQSVTFTAGDITQQGTSFSAYNIAVECPNTLHITIN